MIGERIVYKKGYGPMDGDDAVERLEPTNDIEDGVMLIARGLYRLDKEKGSAAAAAEAGAVISHFRDEWLTYMKRMEE